jgi:hypothetical protein
MKSGNLNFLEPSGPLQACNGTALHFYLSFLKNSEGKIINSPNCGAVSICLRSVCQHVTARKPLRGFPFRKMLKILLAVLDMFLFLAKIELEITDTFKIFCMRLYRGADKSLVRPGRKQGTAIEDFEFHISYLLS